MGKVIEQQVATQVNTSMVYFSEFRILLLLCRTTKGSQLFGLGSVGLYHGDIACFLTAAELDTVPPPHVATCISLPAKVLLIQKASCSFSKAASTTMLPPFCLLLFRWRLCHCGLEPLVYSWEDHNPLGGEFLFLWTTCG